MAELPPPPAGKAGWPWTEETPPTKAETELAPWPRVSIVTTSFNLGRDLEEAIRSVLLQGYPDLEYIVIDGGSTDGSVEVVRKYAPWLAYWVSEPDQGAVHATNKGLERATGALFGLMCADDFYLPGGIWNLVRLRQQRPEAVAWIGTCPEIHPATGKIINPGTPFIRDELALGDWGVGAWFAGVACLFEAQAYRAAGGFDQRFANGSDVDLWLRMSKRGSFALTEELVAKSRLNPHSLSHRDQTLEIASLVTANYLQGDRASAKTILDRHTQRQIGQARVHLTSREYYRGQRTSQLAHAIVPLAAEFVRRLLRPVRQRTSLVLLRPRLQRLLVAVFRRLEITRPEHLAQALTQGLRPSDTLQLSGIAQNLQRFQASLRAHPIAQPGNPPAAAESRPLNLLFIAAMAPSPAHAGGLRVWDIITRLSRAGHGIWLYCPPPHATEPPIGQNLREHCQAIRCSDLAQFGDGDLRAWLRSQGRSLDDFDVIQFEWPFHLDRFQEIFSTQSRTVFTHQESQLRSHVLEFNALPAALGTAERLGLLERFSWSAYLLSLTYARVANHIVLTQADFKFERSFVSGRLEIVPTGLSAEFTEEPSPASVASGNRLCFVGSFNHAPNHDAVVWFMDEVYPQIRAEIADLSVVMVGSGETADLRQRYGQAAIFTGPVPSVVPYIQEATVCIAPLISGAGFRGKVNQYASLTKPTVATSIAASGLAYRDRASIWIADDAGGFAQGVIALLRDPARAKALGEEARQVALATYSWPPIIEKLERFYRQIAGSRPVPDATCAKSS